MMCLAAIAVCLLASSSASAFEYLLNTKWDPGLNSASSHTFTPPNGPRSPGGASWSFMPSGLSLAGTATGIAADSGHTATTTGLITDLMVPGLTTSADYAAVVTAAFTKWASVSGLSNLGEVADAGAAIGGLESASAHIGDIRIGVWEFSDPAMLAHAYAPGTETLVTTLSGDSGGTIFGDVHINTRDPVKRVWINSAVDLAPPGDTTFDLHTVLLHELGHALGLDHSTVPGAVMQTGYRGSRRTLTTDDIEGIQALYGANVSALFSVDGGATNPARVGTANPAEGINTATGPAVNDVFSLGTAPADATPPGSAGGHGLPTEGEIFFSPGDGTNTVAASASLGIGPGPHAPPPAASPVTSPTGSFGIGTLDNIVSLSNASTGTSAGSVLYFSVDPASIGAVGSAVEHQALLSAFGGAPVGPAPTNPGGGNAAGGGEAAGDIFASTVLPSTFGTSGAPIAPLVAEPMSNRLFVDEVALGLQAASANGSIGLGIGEDDLDALELDGPGGGFAFFTLDAASTTSLGLGVTPDGGPIPISYFPHVPGQVVSPDDILITGGAGGFGIFAAGDLHIGLGPGDVIDALVMSDVDQFGPTPDGFLEAGLDSALFSLAPGSPSLGGGSPADVFFTSFGGSFSLFASAESLGLDFFDNINALDIREAAPLPEPNVEDISGQSGAIPEPTSNLLVVLGAAAFGLAGRRGRGRQMDISDCSSGCLECSHRYFV